ncbi:YgjV family protein [uncultured Kriegella sp.]|uniref:YgjV family protein n=1 Tax=uncultured Kriegella sp. TaxID=1798910 RepID=UPI0030DCE821|tara:strand:+ start:166343 stop:166591 length:249 start_codon:yes stop_codon:yes gene_type:complete
MTWITEILGYIAIATGFYAITKKEMGAFRLWHLVSSFFYIIYGVFLESSPLIIAGIVFCVIHVFHLKKLNMKKNQMNKSNKL